MNISKRKIGIILIVLVLLIGFLYYQNNVLSVTKITVTSDKLPSSFEGFKIVHLSDLHNKTFGNEQLNLLQRIETHKPDIIVFTGDLVDKKSDITPSLTLMKKLVNIAPVYFVAGNHEWDNEMFRTLEDQLKSFGVNVLRNRHEKIRQGDDEIYILGMDDPKLLELAYKESMNPEEAIQTALKGIEDNDDFKILLSHRTELFPLYSQYNIDLTFSGHAHGGQFRLPFIGGIIAPDQGFFPKYTSGLHVLDKSQLVISRGLGNSNIPQRIFNRPEIVVVTLSSQ